MGEAKRRRLAGEKPRYRDAGMTLSDFIYGIEEHNGKVPCGSCNACCYHPNIDLTPADDLAYLDTEIRDDGKRYLKRQPDGGCVHLTETGACGVYEHRPLGCRVYDCRLYNAFRIHVAFLGGRKTPNWRWRSPSRADRELDLAIDTALAELPPGLTAEDALDFMMFKSLMPSQMPHNFSEERRKTLETALNDKQFMDKIMKT